MSAGREGITTGGCAAAAALACCLWQRNGVCPERVSIRLPEGRAYSPVVIPHADGTCGVRKDGGDDPDITSGLEVVVRVEAESAPGEIRFFAGSGVGTATQPGLKVAVGDAAINPVPRKMIEEAVRSVFADRGARVTVSIPGGEEIARKTFNPRLGIRGGLSILGTSGVVRPMSAQALRDALREEFHMRIAQGHRRLLYTFGRQGEAAMAARFPDWPIIQVSNEAGFMLDLAAESGVEEILFGGHPGKMAKIAAGIFQTHSRTADGRREAIITQLARMNAPVSLVEAVYASATTEGAMACIRQAGYDAVWTRVAAAAREYCRLRVGDRMRITIVLLDAAGGILGRCPQENS